MSTNSQKRYRLKNIKKIKQTRKKSYLKNRGKHLKLCKQRYEHICDLIESRFENHPLSDKESLLSNTKFIKRICKNKNK